MSLNDMGIKLKQKSKKPPYYENASLNRIMNENQKTRRQNHVNEDTPEQNQSIPENTTKSDPKENKTTNKYANIKRIEPEKKLWNEDGSLFIKKEDLNKTPETVLSPEEEKAKENEAVKQRIERNKKAAKIYKQKAKTLKKLKAEEDDKEVTHYKHKDYQNVEDQSARRNPSEFYKRQQNSVQKRKEAETKPFERKKPQMSAGSKALLKKSPMGKNRSITNDYKIEKPTPEGEEYSFHPDQSQTINYPIHTPRFSLSDVKLLTTLADAKQSTLLVEKELVLEDFDYGLQLETNDADRERKAKRAMKRREEQEQKKQMQIKDPETDVPVQIHHISQMPKMQQEMNELFSLFKDPDAADKKKKK